MKKLRTKRDQTGCSRTLGALPLGHETERCLPPGTSKGTEHKALVRLSLYALPVLVVLGVTLMVVLGLGSTPSQTTAMAQTTAPPDAPTLGVTRFPTLTTPQTTSTTQATTSSSKYKNRHERIMAEQRLRTTTTAAQAGTQMNIPPAGTQTSTPPPTVQTQIAQDQRTSVILTGGRTPLTGQWRGTAEQLAVFLLEASPSPGFTVTALDLAGYYLSYCSEAGLRADLLWAQMLHETGYGRYGGDVAAGQNNFAGLGATGGGAAGAVFATAEAGVMAHVAHMVAYVYTESPVDWAHSGVDPRFDKVSPRGSASILSDLDGRWAVPGMGYGERIENIARGINAR